MLPPPAPNADGVLDPPNVEGCDEAPPPKGVLLELPNKLPEEVAGVEEDPKADDAPPNGFLFALSDLAAPPRPPRKPPPPPPPPNMEPDWEVVEVVEPPNSDPPELEAAEAAAAPPKGEGELAAAAPNTLPLVEAAGAEPNTEPEAEAEVAAAPNTEVPPPVWPPNMEDPPPPLA